MPQKTKKKESPRTKHWSQKKFWTLRNPRTKHIRHIKLAGDMNNNKMERLNGEIRQIFTATKSDKDFTEPLFLR
jgi:hypothetical protein